jgi:hypothetical protein
MSCEDENTPPQPPQLARSEGRGAPLEGSLEPQQQVTGRASLRAAWRGEQLVTTVTTVTMPRGTPQLTACLGASAAY